MASTGRISCAAALAGALAIAPALFLGGAALAQVKADPDPSKVPSGVYTLDHDHGRIVWSLSHHGYSTFRALLPDIKATLTLDSANVANSKLEAEVNMAAAAAGFPEFEGHLKGAGFFNSVKFPTATFKSTKIERTGVRTAKVTGDLTFLGVTRPEVMEVTFNQAGTQPAPGFHVGFDGHMVMKRSLWGMAKSATLGDDVTLDIEAEFIGQKP
jgi:polyisoprenoid-binding protein YceI